MLHHQYWLLKEFCIISFEKNLNIVIDVFIIYKSIKKSYKLLSPPKGFFFFYEILLVMNYLLNYDIGDLWIFCCVVFGPIQKFEKPTIKSIYYLKFSKKWFGPTAFLSF